MKTSAAAEIRALDSGQLQLSGELNFDTVPALMKQAQSLLAQSKAAEVDFSAVTNTNSAGLALLLEISRFMQMRGATIEFKNIPEQIAIVARAYGIHAALESADFIKQATA